MSRVTNEQSLLQDFAERVFADADMPAAQFDWSGARTLVITTEHAGWQQAAAGLTRVQARAADAGFKVLMRGSA